MSELGLLSEWCEEVGVSIGSKEKRQILKYLKELLDWNQRINLIAKAPKEQILRKHFVDSLSIAPLISEGFLPSTLPLDVRRDRRERALKLLDIGTGAGFPGLVLKVIFPEILVYLLESSDKKCVFLKHITSLLRLDGVEILNGRAESYGHDSHYRQRCDIVVCRAVAHLGVISEYAFPFLKPGGYFIAQKGPRGEIELREIKKVLEILGAKLENMKELILPGGEEKRCIFVFRKEQETPLEYPRREGVPVKRPLHTLNVPRGTIG